MDKYKRNIEQIRDRGESAEMYFLKKGRQETYELSNVYTDLISFQYTKDYINKGLTTSELYDELADNLNIIEYLTILFDLDKDKIDSIRNYKLDRGYERGKSE